MVAVEKRVEARAEESPAEVLARLEHYVATLRARPTVDRRAVVVDTMIPVRDRIPVSDATQLWQRRFVSEVAPALIAVTICSFVILLSEWFDIGVAVVVGAALALVGVVGLVRRVPLARAYTFGLVVAALLIRLS
jgi:hypothetical protein